MKQRDSSYAEDWIRVARKDWRRVKTLLDASDSEAAGFYLQQAAEKFLKAFLLKQGRPLKRVHDLETLLNDAVAFEPEFEKYRPVLQKVSAYYIMDRYPIAKIFGISRRDVIQARKELKPLLREMMKRVQI